MLDVLQPLKCSKKIRKPGGEVTEVTFKYEKLSTFCYICVLLGYNDDHCDKIFEMADDGGITDDVMDELNKEKCGVLIGSAMGGMKVTYL